MKDDKYVVWFHRDDCIWWENECPWMSLSDALLAAGLLTNKYSLKFSVKKVVFESLEGNNAF